MNKYKTKPENLQPQLNKIPIRWVRKFISSLDYGKKYKGEAIHCNTNCSTMEFLNGEQKFVYKPNNQNFNDHFNSLETLYFTGNNRGKCLIMIDIDCHKYGSLQGALAFAQFLKDNFFPNLYFEVSTNGNGVHCYFIFNEQFPANHKITLLELGKVLDKLLDHNSFDVEMVEIKGLPPKIHWKNGKVRNYVAGTLAKMPRQVARFNEWEQTTTLDLDQLLNTIDTIKAAIPKTEIPGIKKRKPCGSCSGKHLPMDHLAGYERYAKELMQRYNQPQTSGRQIVNKSDVAYTLMILKHCSLNMNQDGTLPWLRVKNLWDKCYEDGDFERAWDNKRFAAIRNWLSSMGVTDWADNQYAPGSTACKWKLKTEFILELNGIEEPCLTGTTIIPIEPKTIEPVFIRPERTTYCNPYIEKGIKQFKMETKIKEFMTQAA